MYKVIVCYKSSGNILLCYIFFTVVTNVGFVFIDIFHTNALRVSLVQFLLNMVTFSSRYKMTRNMLLVLLQLNRESPEINKY